MSLHSSNDTPKDPLKIFAILRANSPSATNAFNLKVNRKRFCKGISSIKVTPTISSRETTPAGSLLDEEFDGDTLELTFDDVLKTPALMWRFGTNPETSDIHLGARGTREVTSKHCRIFIDDSYKVWMKDIGSTYGSAVNYTGLERDQKRSDYQWILSYGPGESKENLGNVEVLVGTMRWRIDFPNHNLEPPDPTYLKNLRAFVETCKLSLEGLGIDSDPPTQKHSGAMTLATHIIHIQELHLGNGPYGLVYRAINTKTAELCAVKYLDMPLWAASNPLKRTHKDDRVIGDPYQIWLDQIRKDATIMQSLMPHV